MVPGTAPGDGDTTTTATEVLNPSRLVIELAFSTSQTSQPGVRREAVDANQRFTTFLDVCGC